MAAQAELPLRHERTREESSWSCSQDTATAHATSPDTLAKQLSKKIRRRIQGQKKQLLNVLPKQAQFWKLLYVISSDTKQEYDASHELRSENHDNETVTLLYRLVNHMEQPWRPQARARLRLVLRFRNASVPRFNKPRKLPLLAHIQNQLAEIPCQPYSSTSACACTLPSTDKDRS